MRLTMFQGDSGQLITAGGPKNIAMGLSTVFFLSESNKFYIPLGAITFHHGTCNHPTIIDQIRRWSLKYDRTVLPVEFELADSYGIPLG